MNALSSRFEAIQDFLRSLRWPDRGIFCRPAHKAQRSAMGSGFNALLMHVKHHCWRSHQSRISCNA